MMACHRDDYEFPLPETHPFPMEKFRVSARWIAEEDPTVRITVPDPAPIEWLEAVHETAYLRALETGLLSPDQIHRLGLPWGPELLFRSRCETGGTVMAARAALREGLACNLGGGTHHAFPGEGQGYCVLNDVAVAIRRLRQEGFDGPVVVVDTDAHQGNGTHAIFAGDPLVLTYSIHVERNYPSKKVPGTMDVGLPRWVEGPVYLDALEKSLDHFLDAHPAMLAFWISGADPHVDDQFGQMRLTDGEMAARDECVLGHLCGRGLPVAVLYGGGYNRNRAVTARLHANTVLRAARFYRNLPR
jgi:acetoin utilization deacetylase AcuC-like enzyme